MCLIITIILVVFVVITAIYQLYCITLAMNYHPRYYDNHDAM